MEKNETIFDPKSSIALKQWLNGNRIYNGNSTKNFTFGPSTIEGQPHFSLELNKISKWFTNSSHALQSWDSFEDTYYDDEYRMNVITRLIIVTFILLIIVGVREWFIVLIVGLFLLLILWYTLIPSVKGSIYSQKTTDNIQYLRCQHPANYVYKNSEEDFSLYHYLPKAYIKEESLYRLLPNNYKPL